jgi:ABC-type polysaccharide/polyol phosphate export permease
MRRRLLADSGWSSGGHSRIALLKTTKTFPGRINLLWEYRHLIGQLARRDVLARYKKSVLGFVWSLLHPFLMMVVLAVVFSYVGRFNTGIKHYPAFILCGYLPWLFTATSLSTSVRSIVDAGNLLHKVAFPREVLPLAVVGANLFNFVLALIPLFIYISVIGVRFSSMLLFLPVAVLIQTLLLIGFSFILSAAHVTIRDVGVILEVVLLAWFYLCPVFYPPSLVLDQAPAWFSSMYFINPMATLMVIYRVALLNAATPNLDMRIYGLITVSITVIVLAVGWRFFLWRQRSFVEEL